MDEIWIAPMKNLDLMWERAQVPLRALVKRKMVDRDEFRRHHKASQENPVPAAVKDYMKSLAGKAGALLMGAVLDGQDIAIIEAASLYTALLMIGTDNGKAD